MTLTRLLAAGRSIVGIRKGPGPYRMSRRCKQRPFRSNSLWPLPLQASRCAHWSVQHRCLERLSILNSSFLAQWRERLVRKLIHGGSSGIWRRSWRAGHDTVGGGHVQPELPLASLKVVRNDLKDSDGESKTARRPNTLNSGATRLTNSPRTPSGIVWNRLSAPLLRQAAQEFDSAQEQRARFLSHASNGRAGGHGH